MAENNDNNKKKKIVAGIIAALLLLSIGGTGFVLHKLSSNKNSNDISTKENISIDETNDSSIEDIGGNIDNLSPEQRRENTIKLAKYYIAHGDYEHATELLDELLINSPDDTEVQKLIDDVIALKKGALLSEFPEYLPYLEPDSNLEALARANESRRNQIKEQAKANAQARMQSAVDEIAELRRKEMERRQRIANGEADNYVLDEGTKKAIDNAVSKMIDAIGNADADSVIAQFDALKESLPSGDSPEENAYAAQKLSEMAKALYDRAMKETDPVKRAELLAKAKEYADEAARRDPNNQNAQSISSTVNTEASSAKQEQKKIADSATENAKKLLSADSGSVSTEEILNAFDDAYNALPKGDNPEDNAYAAQKLSEMAQALYDRAMKETDPVKRAELLAKAKEFADEAAKRDPNNKTAQSLSKTVDKEVDKAKEARENIVENALSDALSTAKNNSSSVDDILRAFDEVYKSLPKGNNPEDNAYASKKLTEMAQALMDIAEKESDPVKKAALLARAKEYADEAAKRDPNNRTAQNLSNNLDSKVSSARTAQQNATNKGVSDAIKEATSSSSNADDVLNAFEEAYKSIPQGNNPEDNAFASKKLTEMAQALYDRAMKESDPIKKAQLLSKAKEYAEEATKRDPSNEKALNLLLAINKALDSARSGQQKATDKSVSDAIKSASSASSSADDILKAMDEAYKALPKGDNPEDNAYASKKLTEMAQALYDAAEKEKDPIKKAQLLARAKEYADEAARRDPNNAKAKELAKSVEKAADSARANQQKATDSAVSNALKEALSSDTSVDDILKAFDEVYKALPKGDNPEDNAYAAQKLSEMAQALYDRAQKESDPVNKAKLLSRAKEYADEAARRDPNNKTAQNLSENVGKAADNARETQRAISDKAVADAKKTAAGKTTVENVLKAFEEAQKTLPIGNNKEDNEYSSEKLTEMAQSLFERAQKETNNANKIKLLSKAKEYASEAVKRNPANKKAQDLLKQIQAALDAAKSQNRKATETAVSKAKTTAQGNKNSKDTVLKAFDDAYKTIPKKEEEEENDYASEKLTEMAQSLYDRAAKEQDPKTQIDLLSKASDYADEALNRVPSSVKAQEVQEAIRKATEIARDKQRRIADLAMNKAKNADSVEEMLKAMDEAYKQLPSGNTPAENAEAAKKLTEMAQALYDRAMKETDPAKKALLLARAKEYADEAARRDPTNAKAKSLSQTADKAEKSANAEQQKNLADAKKALEAAQNAYSSAQREADNAKKIELLNKAKENVEQALKLDPNNTQAKNLQQQINRALSTAEGNKAKDEAQKAAQQKAAESAVSDATKKALSASSVDDIIRAMEEARSKLPSGNTPEENAYAAQKLSEMAQALYDRAQKETDPVNKAKLLAKAKEFADEAARRDPNNAKAKALQTTVNKANSEAIAEKNKVDAAKKAEEDKKEAVTLANNAQSLYDSAQSAKSTQEKAQLLAKAKEAAKAAVEKDPNNAEAQFMLGILSAETRDYNTALDALTKATKLNPNNSRYFYELGKVQFQLRKYNDAINSFDRAVQVDPKFANAQYNKGVAYERLDNVDKALEAYVMAYTINPQYTKAYISAGAMFKQKKSYDSAIEAYRKAVALDPSDKNALLGLGSVYSSQEKYTEAEQCFRSALKLLKAGEKDAETNYNLSIVLYAQGKKTDSLQYAKAAYDAKESVKDSKMKASIAYNYALNCHDNKMSEQALKLYQEAVLLDSKNINAKVNLGIVNIEMGNFDDAEKVLLQAYQADGSNFEACNNLGSVYRSKKDYPQAIKFYQSALRLQPKNDAVRANLAASYADAGQYKNAKAAYSDVLKQNANNYQAYIELAKVCISLQDTVSAQAYLQSLKEKNPSYKTAEVDSLLSQIK